MRNSKLEIKVGGKHMTEIYENIVVAVFVGGLIAAYIGNTIRLRKMGQ